MTFKMLAEKDKQVARLRAGAEVFARSGVAALEKKLAPFLAGGETLPDVGLLVALAARRVAWLLETLSAAAAAAEGAGVAHSLARSDLELARHRLADLLFHLRDFFHGAAAGRPTVHPRLTEPIPTRPETLVRHADHVLATLRRPSPKLPRCPGVTVDPEQLAASLEPGTDALRVAVAECGERKTEAVRTKEAKKHAEEGYEAEVGPACRLLEALAALAGQRMRPIETRVARIAR